MEENLNKFEIVVCVKDYDFNFLNGKGSCETVLTVKDKSMIASLIVPLASLNNIPIHLIAYSFIC